MQLQALSEMVILSRVQSMLDVILMTNIGAIALYFSEFGSLADWVLQKSPKGKWKCHTGNILNAVPALLWQSKETSFIPVYSQQNCWNARGTPKDAQKFLFKNKSPSQDFCHLEP